MFNFLLFNQLYSKNLDIFLCIDSISALKQQCIQDPQKLVYGYINGKKTPCMTEYELRVHYSQEEFRNKLQSVEQMQKRTLQQNAVYRGDKNLSNADLRGMDLQGMDLSGADLRNAQLESTDLRNANLENANLYGSNLKEAYCKNVNFTGANLSNAQIKGTFFQNANLNETEGLTIENLSTVATLHHAKLNDTLYKLIEKKYPLKLNLPKETWIPKIFDSTQIVLEPKEKSKKKKHK
jgi:uncharacterized protein YjbI with pentapeptide repeats